jgi:hypothetical protein
MFKSPNRNIPLRHRGSADSPRPARICEVREFVDIESGREFVLVNRYRTIYHPDGRISKEWCSVEPAGWDGTRRT